MQDELWKKIIEQLFPDFVSFFLPELAETIDFSQAYTFLDKELAGLFADSAESKRRVDKLAKVFLKDGQEQWILIHAEVQGYYDKVFTERMWSYFYRIYDKYKQKIAAIAVFAEDKPNWMPNEYKYQFSQTELIYRYPVYKILDQDEAELQQSDNPFAMVVLAALYALRSKKTDEELKLHFKLELTSLLFKKGYEATKIKSVFHFVNTLIKMNDELTQARFFEEAKKMATLNKKVELLSDFEEVAMRKGRKEGKKEGIVEGKVEAKVATASKMIADGMAHELIQKYTGLSLEEIAQLKPKAE